MVATGGSEKFLCGKMEVHQAIEGHSKKISESNEICWKFQHVVAVRSPKTLSTLRSVIDSCKTAAPACHFFIVNSVLPRSLSTKLKI
jgi:hypothetical protein